MKKLPEYWAGWILMEVVSILFAYILIRAAGSASNPTTEAWLLLGGWLLFMQANLFLLVFASWLLWRAKH